MPCGASCLWHRSMERSCRRIRAPPSWPAVSGRPDDGWRMAASPRFAQRGVSATPPPTLRGELTGSASLSRPARWRHVVTAERDTTCRNWWPRFCAVPRKRLTRGFGRARWDRLQARNRTDGPNDTTGPSRSEEHTSELQSHVNLVCRLLLEKKKKKNKTNFLINKKNKKKIKY